MVEPSLGEYCRRVVHREWRLDLEAALNGRELATLARRTLHRALRRLDALPGEHPFWRHASGPATICKLSLVLDEWLQRDPADEAALWAQAALALYYGHNNFGAPAWRRLAQVGRLDVRWPICAAYYIWASSGVRTSQALISLLRELTLWPAAERALCQLRGAVDTGALLREWVEEVMRHAGDGDVQRA